MLCYSGTSTSDLCRDYFCDHLCLNYPAFDVHEYEDALVYTYYVYECSLNFTANILFTFLEKLNCLSLWSLSSDNDFM